VARAPWDHPAVRGRDIASVLAAEGVSNFGSMLSRLAIAWIATLALGATPASMALLLVADVAAGAAGALLLGPSIERAPKRLAMLWADALRALVLAAVALGAWSSRLTLPWLIAAAAAGGLLNVAFDLPARNAQLSMIGSVSETAAFALGDWLYQALGAVLALAGDALSYLGSALLLRGVREVPGVVSASEGAAASPWRAWWQEQSEGWAVLHAHARLRALAVVEALLGLGASLAATSYMVYVARDLALPTGLAVARRPVSSRAAAARVRGEALLRQRLRTAGYPRGSFCRVVHQGMSPVAILARQLTHHPQVGWRAAPFRRAARCRPFAD
jgi:hypothetical protein